MQVGRDRFACGQSRSRRRIGYRRGYVWAYGSTVLDLSERVATLGATEREVYCARAHARTAPFAPLFACEPPKHPLYEQFCLLVAKTPCYNALARQFCACRTSSAQAGMAGRNSRWWQPMQPKGEGCDAAGTG
jgi:hypothetical protein